ASVPGSPAGCLHRTPDVPGQDAPGEYLCGRIRPGRRWNAPNEYLLNRWLCARRTAARCGYQCSSTRRIDRSDQTVLQVWSHRAGFVSATLEFDPLAAGRFLLTVATLPKIIGGCVVDSSGEEGAGAASAVGQAAAVHGAAQPGVEHLGRGARGWGVPGRRHELVSRVQRSTGMAW